MCLLEKLNRLNKTELILVGYLLDIRIKKSLKKKDIINILFKKNSRGSGNSSDLHTSQRHRTREDIQPTQSQRNRRTPPAPIFLTPPPPLQLIRNRSRESSSDSHTFTGIDYGPPPLQLTRNRARESSSYLHTPPPLTLLEPPRLQRSRRYTHRTSPSSSQSPSPRNQQEQIFVDERLAEDARLAERLQEILNEQEDKHVGNNRPCNEDLEEDIKNECERKWMCEKGLKKQYKNAAQTTKDRFLAMAKNVCGTNISEDKEERELKEVKEVEEIGEELVPPEIVENECNEPKTIVGDYWTASEFTGRVVIQFHMMKEDDTEISFKRCYTKEFVLLMLDKSPGYCIWTGRKDDTGHGGGCGNIYAHAFSSYSDNIYILEETSKRIVSLIQDKCDDEIVELNLYTTKHSLPIGNSSNDPGISRSHGNTEKYFYSDNNVMLTLSSADLNGYDYDICNACTLDSDEKCEKCVRYNGYESYDDILAIHIKSNNIEAIQKLLSIGYRINDTHWTAVNELSNEREKEVITDLLNTFMYNE